MFDRIFDNEDSSESESDILDSDEEDRYGLSEDDVNGGMITIGAEMRIALQAVPIEKREEWLASLDAAAACEATIGTSGSAELREVWNGLRGAGAGVERRAASGAEAIYRVANDECACRFAIQSAEDDARWPANQDIGGVGSGVPIEIEQISMPDGRLLRRTAGHRTQTDAGFFWQISEYSIDGMPPKTPTSPSPDQIDSEGQGGGGAEVSQPVLSISVAEWLGSVGLGHHVTSLSTLGTIFADFHHLQATDLLAAGVTNPEDQAAILTR
jgi:hypothetical protein